jgi:hypothetical protein
VTFDLRHEVSEAFGRSLKIDQVANHLAKGLESSSKKGDWLGRNDGHPFQIDALLAQRH